MKKIFFLIIWFIVFQNLSLAGDIRNFQIEKMSIGDSALDYFSVSQLEDNEQGWHNYSYNEYSSSYMPGKGIYSWFLVSYKNDDNNFIIEGLVGGLEKSNLDSKECNNKMDVTALSISELFKNITIYVMSILYVYVGFKHFLHTEFFVTIVPPFIKWKKEVVL